jgi:hypothetical protein
MIVNQILEGISTPDLALVAEALDSEVTPFTLDHVNWEKFPYKPEVAVQIAYNSEELFLKYTVCEQAVKAEITQSNGAVWTDSCVEFFISPDANDAYYNFEFNAIETALLGYRMSGQASEHATEEVIDSIRRESSLGHQPFSERKGKEEWTLVVAIPHSALFHHDFRPKPGVKTKANFYKCGDELSVPHFVSWTHINTETPSFHAPRFFGVLEFA